MKFDYSQNKLHDYLECPRRFELRYLLQRIWPAVHSEPVLEMEEQINNGKIFHLMAQQYFSGIHPDVIFMQVENVKISNWWKEFIRFAEAYNNLPHQSEVLISSKINNKSFVGVFDLLVYSPGEKITIIDWKTNHTRPSRKNLEQHVQTRLYPLLLTSGGKQWNNNNEIKPDQIEMIYWFANYPDEQQSFLYSEHQYQADLNFIQDLINQIESTNLGEFTLTANQKRCNFCNYRSLCGRGIKPGSTENLDTVDFDYLYEEIEEIDMNQIGDIAF
jgi:predicted RecB family nuclease